VPEPKRVPKREPKEDPGDSADDFDYLGREFMTWLLFRADAGEAIFGKGKGKANDEFTFFFGGKARFASAAGFATDLVLKGRAPAHGAEARAAIGSGHALREAELRVVKDEREWRGTLVADTLDWKGVKLPALLTEEDDEKLLERMTLLEELDAMVQTAFADFLKTRVRPAWRKEVVPALRTWIVEGLAIEG
jgi:hypothetical protein